MSIEMMTLVWKKASLAGSELIVLLAMADYAHDDGSHIFPSIPTVATKARLSEDQARRVIHKLVDEIKVLVLVERGGWRNGRNWSNEYAIDLGVLAQMQPPRVDATTRPRVDATTVPAPTRGDPLLESSLLTVSKNESVVPHGTPPSPDVSVKEGRSRRSRKAELESPPNSDDPPLAKEPSKWQKFVGALCWICYGHDKVDDLTEAQRGLLLAEAKKINGKGYTVEDLKKWYLDIWRKGWKYSKDESRPNPAEVRSGIPVLKATAPEGFDGKEDSDGEIDDNGGWSAEELAALEAARAAGDKELAGRIIREGDLRWKQAKMSRMR